MDQNDPLIMSFLECFDLSIKSEVFYDCNLASFLFTSI